MIYPCKMTQTRPPPPPRGGMIKKDKNIARNTVHSIVAWLNPKQWLMNHVKIMVYSLLNVDCCRDDGMMTSWNGNIFCVTDPLCGEFTSHRWLSFTKASDAELWFFFICAWINGWVNNREAGDLRRNRAHYDVIVMRWKQIAIKYQHE